MDALEDLAGDWARIEVSSPSELAMLAGPDLLISWYRHVRPLGIEPLVAFLVQSGELRGVAPLARWKGSLAGIPIRRIDLAGLSIDAGGLLLPEERPEVVRTLLEETSRAYGPDLILLADFGSTGPDAAEVAAAGRSMGIHVEAARFRYARADMSGGYVEYASRKGRSFRRHARVLAARWQEAGSHSVEVKRGRIDPDEGDALLGRIAAIANRNRAAAGRDPMPQSELAYRGELIRRLGVRGHLLAAFLTVDGRDVAYVLAAVGGTVCVDHFIGHDRALAELSPGTYLRYALMQRLSESGIKTVVSPGDYSYKQRWATEFRQRERLFCFARTPRARLARLARFVVPRVVARVRTPLAPR